MLVNGKPQDTIPIQERAFHYGDGLFETIAVNKGKMLAWPEHYQRLLKGCEVLGMEIPDEDLLLREANTLLKNQERRVFKIILSRGQGGRGYTPPEKPEVSRFLLSYDWPSYPEEFFSRGITTDLSPIRLGHNPLLAGIKHLNRLEQVLIKREMLKSDCTESVVRDLQDRVIEGSMCNIFIVKDKHLLTPELNSTGVKGIIRQLILELASEHDIATKECSINVGNIQEADEIFFCNSIVGIWPVRKFLNYQFKPGPITLNIRSMLLERELIIAQ